MKTVSDILDALGGNTAVAKLIGAKHASTVSEMRRRGSIPVEHWPKLIAASQDLDAETILIAHSGAGKAHDVSKSTQEAAE